MVRMILSPATERVLWGPEKKVTPLNSDGRLTSQPKESSYW